MYASSPFSLFPPTISHLFIVSRRNDPKTVNVISTGVFSKNTNIVVAALKFFLTVAADDEEDRIAEQKEKVFLIFLSQ